MEGNYLTSGDLAMWADARDGRSYDCGCYRHRGDGKAVTGVGLGAASLGAIVIGGFALAFGLNQASKARARAAENAAAGNARAIDILAQQALADRQSRETWQNNHAPTISQYVDVRAGAGAGANALSTAEAAALAAAINNNGGLNSAIGGCNFLRVARYSAPKPCGCDTCEG